MTEDRGVWVYAVTRSIEAGWLAGISGLDGEPVRPVAAAGLAAAVTTVGLAGFGEQALRRHLEDLDWLAVAARAHHLVIGTLAARRPTVPMRLATVYRDDQGVAGLLAEQQADFAAALERVTGRAEWGVKLYPAARPATAAAAGPSAGGRAAGTGAAYLSRRRQELSAAKQGRQAAVASAEHIRAMLGRLAVAAQLRPPQDPQLSGQADQMIMNAAYLVDDTRSAAFTAAVAELAAARPAVRAELTGPWPPYSFAAVADLRAAG